MNIPYELAVELKECGFAQDNTEKIYYTVDAISYVEPQVAYRTEDLGLVEVGQIIALPTLSELIEAASRFDPHDKFLWSLERRSGGGWEAHNSTKTIKTEAETPEETVALFWLKVNKP